MRSSESERVEVKFALPRADLGKLETILEVNCRRISYRNRTSRVASMYFDDARLSACHENLDGSSRRAKLRLRWYDAEFPRGEVFLEIKRRVGQGTTKERHRLDVAARFESVSTRETVRALSKALPRVQKETFLSRPDPIVIVEYERSYFEAEGGAIRITLDRDLVFYSQVGRLRPTRHFPVRAPEAVIVEAKTSGESEEAVREILHPLAPRVTRSSKYVLGCQAVGLLPGSHYV
jgi:hypothetical protein